MSRSFSASSSTVLSFNQSSPSYDIVCPGDTLVFTCISRGIFVFWRINLKQIGPLTNYDFKFERGFNIGITNINNTTPTITSTATNESVTSELNGTVIDCSGNGVQYSNTLTVHIAGKIYIMSHM